MTIDVEDWFQVENLRQVYPIEQWDFCDQRIESNTKVLLDLLDEHDVTATFFVLGWVAERYGGLVKDIYRRGHEIASHGYNHQLCFGLSTEDLREDLYRSKSILEDLTGYLVDGYRAPSFSITDDVFKLLGELGYRYDSSYNSFSANKRHGRPHGLRRNTDNDMLCVDDVIELPISNLTFLNCPVPWGGGGYFRFWPSRLFDWGITRILKTDGCYIFYCHPWEIDAMQPRVKQIGWLGRYRHYLNLSETLNKIDHFLTRFRQHRFASCHGYLNMLEEESAELTILKKG